MLFQLLETDVMDIGLSFITRLEHSDNRSLSIQWVQMCISDLTVLPTFQKQPFKTLTHHSEGEIPKWKNSSTNISV